MLYRPTPVPLPRQRMSPAALATTGALHIALVWLLMQHTPVQQAVRYVVYQVVRPQSAPATSSSSASANSSSRAITMPSRRGEAFDPPEIFSNTPQSSVPMQVTNQLLRTPTTERHNNSRLNRHLLHLLHLGCRP